VKQFIKRVAASRGIHIFTDDSMPTGVNWLHDIRRSGLLSARPLCLDVGANVGQTVLELRAALPGSCIHAFEPFDQPYAELSALCGQLPEATAVKLALGAAPGSIEAVAHETSVLSSLAHAPTAVASVPRQQIQIDTVDAYRTRQHIGIIDILKTDTEGYDLEVLQGAAARLRAKQVRFVYAEVSFFQGNTQNTPFQPLFAYLSDHGYRFLGLYETYPLHHFKEPNLFCNALFSCRQLHEQ